MYKTHTHKYIYKTHELQMNTKLEYSEEKNQTFKTA